MFRAAAAALVALVAFGYFYFDGWYTHAAVVLNFYHGLIGY